MMYVVEALRWNDREMHSYVVGVYEDLHIAYRAAIAEEYWRGGKYTCAVTEHQLNAENKDVEGKSKEEWCGEHCLPDGVYALDIMTRVNQHLRLYDV